MSARQLDSDEEKQLVADAGHPSYFDGYLLFARGGTLFATRFDANRLEVSGTPVPVLEGVWFNSAAGAAQYAISANGRLAYVPAAAQSGRLLSAVDRSGVVVTLSDVRRRFYMPRVSPDGRRIAVTLEIDGAYSIWILDIATGTLSQVVDAGMDPVWSPDGRRLVFSTPRSTGTALQIIAADRSSAVTDLLSDSSQKVPTSWSRDDKWIAFTRVQEGSPAGEDVFLIAPDGSGLHPLVQGPGNQNGGVFSPDGRWLAYSDADAGMVFVSPVANPTQRRRVDTDGAFMPQWSPDGRELFFLGRQFDQLLGAAVIPGPDGLLFAKPTLVAQVRMGSGLGFGLQRYDVMPDGRRFVFATADVASPPTQIRIVLDFGLQLASLLRR